MTKMNSYQKLKAKNIKYKNALEELYYYIASERTPNRIKLYANKVKTKYKLDIVNYLEYLEYLQN